MGTFKNSAASVVLRVGIMLCLAIFFLAPAFVGIMQGTFMNKDITPVTAIDGVSDLRGLASTDSIVSLNGTWEYYPDVFEVSEYFDPRLLDGIASEPVTFPLDNTVQSTGSATYRLLLQTDRLAKPYSFYLEHYDEDFAIYLNGVNISPVKQVSERRMIYSLSDYLFRIDTPIEAGAVEILISANSSRAQSLLYRNPIIFGPSDDLADYITRVWRDDTFLIGIIMVMVIVGLIFSLFRSKFDMLTSITLFDTFLSIHILLGYSVATFFIHSVFPLQLGNVEFEGLRYVAFFLAGAFGCLLSQSIFDPKQHLSARPIQIQMAVCAFGCLFTLCFFGVFPMICIGLLFLVLFGSFVIVTWHVTNLMKERKLNSYYIFQIIKTYYIGGIMIVDILNIRALSYNALIYAYAIFFFAHLAARIMDNYASYQEVEKLNHNLEEMIDARTSQLTETNRRLSELSVRDPLTQAHNRLYFENSMETLLRSETEELIYLCMFDLDYFKQINDRHGHLAGDEQLIFVVQTVNNTLGNRGTLSRIGGEEFVILFTGESKENVLALLEQIRRQLAQDAGSNEKRTTASFGLVKCESGDSSKEVLRAADRCLYSAKKMGRNCIVVS